MSNFCVFLYEKLGDWGVLAIFTAVLAMNNIQMINGLGATNAAIGQTGSAVMQSNAAMLQRKCGFFAFFSVLCLVIRHILITHNRRIADCKYFLYICLRARERRRSYDIRGETKGFLPKLYCAFLWYTRK